MTKLARRTLLRAIGWISFGLVTGSVGRAAPPTVPADAARVVGRAYLDAYPEERARLRGLRLDTRRALARRIRRDFERGDVVWVRGFLLARSEARHCARLKHTRRRRRRRWRHSRRHNNGRLRNRRRRKKAHAVTATRRLTGREISTAEKTHCEGVATNCERPS